jgi:fatty acid desaturase
MLKYKADVRSLGYFAVTTLLFALQWHYGFNLIVFLVYLHFSVAVSVITHNHNHINMWKSKWPNLLTDWWLTVFYGLPIFVWIPTHNRNHHRYNNKLEDTTRTYRHTEENDVLSLVQYPSRSGYHQMKERIIPYMQELKQRNVEQYRQNWMQVVALAIWMVVFFVWNWKKALLYVFIPQQVSQFAVMIFNYVQHVHADEESEYNHSRNFMGVNLFLFNNGYHTIHHHRASIHWSETPEAHKEIAQHINPELIQSTFWGYIIKTYVVSLFVPSYRSISRRLERISRTQKAKQAEVV